MERLLHTRYAGSCLLSVENRADAIAKFAVE